MLRASNSITGKPSRTTRRLHWQRGRAVEYVLISLSVAFTVCHVMMVVGSKAGVL